MKHIEKIYDISVFTTYFKRMQIKFKGRAGIMEKANVREYLKLNVRMFGKFQMMNEEGVLTAESIHSEMLTRLLTYMM